MNAKFLIPLAWSLWALLLLGLGFVGLRALTERTHSPEVGRGFGVFVVGILLVVLLALGGVIYWAAQRQSIGGLISLVLVLAYPLVILIAGPVVKGIKQWRYDREDVRTGDFRDPQAMALAEPIVRNDVIQLKQLLADQRAPETRDQAGHNLLEFAVVTLCDGKGGLDCVRALLEAGMSARDARDKAGRPLTLVLLLSHYRVPQFREAIELLLQHGAEADQTDANGETTLRHAGGHPDIVRLLIKHGADVERLNEYGESPVVTFTSHQHWESALHLVELGVRLDVVSSHGISLDYYLKEWKESVYGKHPEGWDRLRAAILKRRGDSANVSAR